MSESVVVSVLPECDIHKHMLGESGVLAAYDGATTIGRWAFMCEEHFQVYGVGLGTGRGQRLVLASSQK